MLALSLNFFFLSFHEWVREEKTDRSGHGDVLDLSSRTEVGRRSCRRKKQIKVVESRLSLASMEAMNVQKERGRAIKETASSNGEMKVSHHILYIFYSYHLFAGGILFLETN
jgi:hypothetical protein